jgi:hypothetical protein
MRSRIKSFDYEPSAVLVAWVSAVIGPCLAILFILFPSAGIDSYHPCEQGIGTTTYLYHSSWCIASYLLAALIALIGSVRLKRFMPAWLFISILGSLIYPFTLWGFAYWSSMRSYQADSIFCSPPPTFQVILKSATSAVIICFLLSALSSLFGTLLLSKKAESSGLHLDN